MKAASRGFSKKTNSQNATGKFRVGEEREKRNWMWTGVILHQQVAYHHLNEPEPNPQNLTCQSSMTEVGTGWGPQDSWVAL